jgi:hypothetical protein
VILAYFNGKWSGAIDIDNTGDKEGSASPVLFWAAHLTTVSGLIDVLLEKYLTDGHHQYSKLESGWSLMRKVSSKWKKAIRGDQSVFDMRESGINVDRWTSREEWRSMSLPGSRTVGRIDTDSCDTLF